MFMKDKIVKVIKNPEKIFVKVLSLNVFKYMSDERYLKLMYRYKMGKKLDFDNVKTFNEKLQWLKINNKNNFYTGLVDKYQVREYIRQVLGEEYLIPLVGVWDNANDIDLNTLPDEFVLKCNHDSGGVIVCRDKSKFDMKQVARELNKRLSKNFYYVGREWPYKNIKPKVICEELLKTKDGTLPIDYKFSCFNGKVDNVMLCMGRETGKTKFYFFDKKWNLLRYNVVGREAPNNFTIPKPKMIDKMFEIAEILAKDFPYVRVDLYCEEEKIYFGELTFYPDCGFDSNLLKETDELFGDMIKLDNIK